LERRTEQANARTGAWPKFQTGKNHGPYRSTLYLMTPDFATRAPTFKRNGQQIGKIRPASCIMNGRRRRSSPRLRDAFPRACSQAVRRSPVRPSMVDGGMSCTARTNVEGPLQRDFEDPVGTVAKSDVRRPDIPLLKRGGGSRIVRDTFWQRTKTDTRPQRERRLGSLLPRSGSQGRRLSRHNRKIGSAM
jgi:hypothetical protein